MVVDVVLGRAYLGQVQRGGEDGSISDEPAESGAAVHRYPAGNQVLIILDHFLVCDDDGGASQNEPVAFPDRNLHTAIIAGVNENWVVARTQKGGPALREGGASSEGL